MNSQRGLAVGVDLVAVASALAGAGAGHDPQRTVGCRVYHSTSSALFLFFLTLAASLRRTHCPAQGPLTIVSVCKNLTYLIVNLTAATLPTLALAAHQAAFSVWTLATWTISPVEQVTRQ